MASYTGPHHDYPIKSLLDCLEILEDLLVYFTKPTAGSTGHK
jgi:hypothetical protein